MLLVFQILLRRINRKQATTFFAIHSKVMYLHNVFCNFSKVMYLHEQQLDVIKSLSDRIDLATKFRTYAEKFSAENYQVMNYGIGGSIVGHLDSTGKKSVSNVINLF